VILLGDAQQALDTFPQNHFDLIILDPNYEDWDRLVGDGMIQQVLSVLKDTGNVICFTKQPFDFALRVECHDYLRRQIIWSFSNGGAWVSHKMPLVSFQIIYWLTKSPNFFFNPRTGMAYSANTKSFKRSNKVFGNYKQDGKQFDMSENGTWMRDHYHFEKPSKGNMFEKPIDLLTVFIKCLCPERGLILDPFCGAGTSGVVAARHNRRWIGCELNPEYAKLAEERISKETNLFTETV